MTCEIMSLSYNQATFGQETFLASNRQSNLMYNSSYMDDSSEEVSNDIERIQLYYENQMLRALLKEQQDEVESKQKQIDQLHEKMSVLLNAFVLKARGDKQLNSCAERCKEEKKYLERDILVKSQAYQEVEIKFMAMNRYLQEVEDQNKKLLTEISILTEKETIRQFSASQENLMESLRSCTSTPNPQDQPKVKYTNDKDEKINDKVFKKSRIMRNPMKKAKSFNFEKAVKANSKKEKLF